MLMQHWLLILVAVIAGCFVQRWFDPLSKVGL